MAHGAASMCNGEAGKGVGSRWYPATIAKRIMAVAEHRDRIEFIEGDAMPLLELLLPTRATSDVVAFVDPPYTAGGKNPGDRLYQHSKIDHARLFRILAESTAHFMMTYNASSSVAALVQHHAFSAVGVRARNAHNAMRPELVITRHSVFSSEPQRESVAA